MVEEKKKKEYYTETKTTKWAFRIGSVLFILLFCYVSIKMEFNSMKKEKQHQAFVEKLSTNFDESMLALQDSWNTMYYFYQTGDLFKILRCPNVKNTDEKSVEEDALLRLFREPYDKRIKEDDLIKVGCGDKINILIGEKDDPYSKAKNQEEISFNIGKEPLKLLEQYPFIRYAVKDIKMGEKATFIAIPKERTKIRTRRSKIYEIKSLIIPDTKVIKTPSAIKMTPAENKYFISEKAYCGAVLNIFYTIRDIDDNIIGKEKQRLKIKLGEHQFNTGIEKVLENSKSGEQYRIFLTKNFFETDKNTDFIRQNQVIKDKDIVIVDVIVVSVK